MVEANFATELKKLLAESFLGEDSAMVLLCPLDISLVNLWFVDGHLRIELAARLKKVENWIAVVIISLLFFLNGVEIFEGPATQKEHCDSCKLCAEIL